LGAGVVAPLATTWYNMLVERLFQRWDNSRLSTLLAKTAAEQVLFAPVLNASFMVSLGVLEGRNMEEIRTDLRTKFLSVMRGNWAFWAPVGLAMYKFVPPQLRVLVGKLVSVVWMVFLISMTSRSGQRPRIRFLGNCCARDRQPFPPPSVTFDGKGHADASGARLGMSSSAQQDMELSDDVIDAPESTATVVVAQSDPYKILGVGLEATEDEIKKAYKQLSLRYHPDKNPDDALAKDRFQLLSEAYQLLVDPDFRKAYNQLESHLPGILEGLKAYSLKPQPSAFIGVYSTVFNILTDKGVQNVGVVSSLRLTLHSEVSQGMERLADCLRQRSCEPHLAWMKRAIAEMYEVRNHFYCLQAALAFACRHHELDECLSTALTDAMHTVGFRELSQSFQFNITKVVENNAECAKLLPELMAMWSRCSCPVAALRIPVVPKSCEIHATMRAAFPLMIIPLNPPTGSFFRMDRKHLITLLAGFLSDEDIRVVFYLHRGYTRASMPALGSTLMQTSSSSSPSSA